MSGDVQGIFVSQKISKIRWIHEDYAESKCFITGSWDDDHNAIKVWSCFGDPRQETPSHPRVLSQSSVNGDVTEIKFTDNCRIAASVSSGDVHLLEISSYDKSTPPRVIYSWEKLHSLGLKPCSCSCLDTLDGDIVTGGEDGVINALNCRQGAVSCLIKDSDGCSFNSICFLRYREIITGDIRGHMKTWDLRMSTEEPTSSFLLSDEELAATCISNHPTQPYIVLVGSESGSLTVWDLRMKSYPASALKGHKASLTEMQFHPENPQKLFTSSASGEIWSWNMDIINRSTRNPEAQAVMAWTPLEDKMNKIVNNLMPAIHQSVNTLHCDKDKIIAGADNEAVYLLNKVQY